jgi:branched-chain amino acid transport system ATP-binding protein
VSATTSTSSTTTAAATAGGGEIVLRTEGLGRAFRGLQALVAYRLELRRGEILGVIGPNGAGKSTLFNVLTGFLPPTAGRVHFLGRDITGFAPDKIARLGIARTFQNIRLFGRMSVLDNVKTAQQLHGKAGFLETLLSAPGFLRKERVLEERALAHLASLGMARFAGVDAAALPYGFQRKLEIARALATEPTVLLLDEPAAGMNEGETAELTTFIREIRDRFGLTVVVVEHDMSLIMPLSDRIQVLNYGRIIAEGTPSEIRANPAVIEAYLGGADDAPALASTLAAGPTAEARA